MHLLSKLHARLGDFWWYSLLLFAALRCGDLINAFVGLWLVPKYVPPEELGAVLPLMSFSTFIGFPMGSLHIASLRNIIWALIAFASIRAVIIFAQLILRRHQKEKETK